MGLASILSSEVLSVSSEHTGEDYQISVSLPRSYFDDLEVSFPVVYVVDANLMFEAVVGLTRLMQLAGALPEFVVVGVGYALEGNYGDGLSEFARRRARDLTSTVDERYEQFAATVFSVDGTIETGGADKFLGFVARELMPLVEEQYRLDPDNRTLLGHSSGGHFALYALLTQPQLFKRYAVGSPSLGFGNGRLFDLEEEYASRSDELPARLFLGIGGEEEHSPRSPAGYIGEIVSVSDFYRFTAILEERGYRNLQMSKQVFEGHGHTDVLGPFVASALRYVFSNT